MPEKLSAKQEEILEFIKQEILSRGYPPSVRDICQAVGLKSTSSVHAHLEKLEEYGYIRRDPAKSRTIEILDDTFGAQRKDMVNVPEVGTVAAGMPLLAEQNITDYIPIPAEMLPNAETFILRVRGESMINAGIFNNDRLIVERQNTARNGEIVVALIDDGATVKRFYKEKGHVRLQPENDAMDPIIVSDCRVLGKVVGLFRTDIR
ncbi:MAG: transcriptional repressor LexA [Lachnospira sp.]|nr:transcriptional repressor LexA [Lachnospira sp.]